MQKDLAIKSLNNLLNQLKLKAEIESCKVEDSFLIFDIKLGPGGTFKKLEKCATEIALALKALSEPLIYPVMKDGIIRMEVMIAEQKTVFFKDVIESEQFTNSDAILPLVLGGLRDGCALVADLTKMPHLLVSGSTGCHARGTGILMYDGAIKNIEDIKINDVLMGPNSMPRKVLKLFRGKEKMYKIIPTKGDSFIVNENHILSLIKTNCKIKSKEIINISVKNYINKSKSFKHLYKLYRCPVEKFGNETPVKEPYFVGLLLGDGAIKHRLSFSTQDNILVEEIKKAAHSFNSIIKKRAKYDYFFSMINQKNFQGKSELRKFLEEIGIYGTSCHDKFVPHSYKTASWKDRLEILAGLIDTDGSCDGSGFDFISKSHKLATDVVFIARSLGLAAYMKESWKLATNGKTKIKQKYYRVYISGNCSIIPCRISRKQATKRRQIKDVLKIGFSIESLNEDNFYGVEVSDDNLYLMGDFTVTHNSGKSVLLQSIINSLLINSRAQVKLALIDPKRVEFTYYHELNNLYAPVARDVESAISLLHDLIDEMDARFLKLEKSGVRDILNYDGNMPYIVVVIDELADLMMASKKEAQDLICRLAQKSRACGIHLVIATQRPSVNVVTGIIKANFPARLSCQVTAAVDSRTILDRNGAETLVGKGDAIIDCSEHKFKRFKGAFLTEDDIAKNVSSNKKSWLRRIWTS